MVLSKARSSIINNSESVSDNTGEFAEKAYTYPTGHSRVDYGLETAADLEGYGSPEEFRMQDPPAFDNYVKLFSAAYRLPSNPEVADDKKEVE
jgi:hypothetical protein